MPGVVRPPFGAPTGPLIDDDELVSMFIAGGRTGYSKTFHIEEDTLLVDRFVPVAIRVGLAVLVRSDVAAEGVRSTATQDGLELIEQDPPLSTVVALQALGLPAATWDLWGTDRVDAQEQLRRVAAGGTGGPGGA